MPTKEFLERIERFNKFGSKLGLERIARLLELLDNPEKELKVIHVGGTNGKGSTCKFIYNILLENNYSVGLYTSPFLEIFNERIETNRQYISDDDLERLSKIVIEQGERIYKETGDSPTEFEIVTAMAFLYFKEQNLDFVVLEVGLGGRGDSTNIMLKPLITAITSISMDHMERLGDSLSKIAYEKSGIIKVGVPVVLSANDTEAKKVIAREAYKKNARIYDVSKTKYSILKEDMDGTVFNTNINGEPYEDVEISMIGRHQVSNCITALACIEILRKNGIIKVGKKGVFDGVLKARHNGRFEIIDRKNNVILDGAHNLEGILGLKQTIDLIYPKENGLVVVGMLEEKCTKEVLEALGTLAGNYIVSEPDHANGMKSQKLATAIKKNTNLKKEPEIIFEGNTRETTDYVAQIIKNNEQKYKYIVFTGSLYFIGQVRTLIGGKNETR